MGVIIFVLILSFLVIIHELGHFFAALWAKVKVDEFGLGYPPKALKLFRWKNADFTFNWIPFGGFVRMQGEDGYEDTDPSVPTKLEEVKSGQFYQATPLQKLVIIVAGPLVNFIFGILAFTIVFTNTGIPTLIDDVRIGATFENSPAKNAGIKDNTNVVAVQLQDSSEVIQINKVEQFIDIVKNNQGKNIKVTTTGICDSDGCQETAQVYDVYVRKPEEVPQGEGAIGIAFDQVVYKFYPWYEMPFRSSYYGVKQALYMGVEILNALSSLASQVYQKGSMPNEIAGPVGIVHQAQKIGLFKEGLLTLLSFSGMLSINLAVMNMLPIPPLDGGRAVFAFLEFFLKKSKLQKIENALNSFGFICLMALIVFITFKDISRIFEKPL